MLSGNIFTDHLIITNFQVFSAASTNFSLKSVKGVVISSILSDDRFSLISSDLATFILYS